MESELTKIMKQIRINQLKINLLVIELGDVLN